MMDSWQWIIIIGLPVLAIIIAIALASRRSWRRNLQTIEAPIEHYTEQRDEASIPEDEEEEEAEDDSEDDEDTESAGGGVSGIGTIVSGAIVLAIMAMMVGLIWPTLMTAMKAANMANETGTSDLINSAPMWGLMQMIVIMAVVFALVSVMFGGLNSGSDNSENSETKPKRVRKRGVAHYTQARDKMSRRTR